MSNSKVLRSIAIAFIMVSFVAGQVQAQAARQSYHQTQPGEVALSGREIYVLGRYVKIDGDSTQLKQVDWERGYPTRLLITISTWLPRNDELILDIVVPDRIMAQAEDVVQRMVSV